MRRARVSGAAAAILELHPPMMSECPWLSTVAPLQGFQLGLVISADHVLISVQAAPRPPWGRRGQEPGWP